MEPHFRHCALNITWLGDYWGVEPEDFRLILSVTDLETNPAGHYTSDVANWT